jgi:hypothetical protein
MAKIGFLFASSITNAVLKGELPATVSASFTDAFERTVNDDESITDEGASMRTRSKSAH